MENIDFTKSLLHLKIKWERPAILNKYILSFIILVLNIVSIALLTEKYNEFGSFWRYYISAIAAAIFLLSLLILSLRAIVKNDRLRSFPMKQPLKEIRKIIENKLTRDGYIFIRSNEKYIIAKKPGKFFTDSCIVVLFHQKSIYLNVQNGYGFRGYFPFSFGRNKRIIKDIINEI